MTSSKIFKKENGDKYEVKISLSTDSYSDEFYWNIRIYFCPADKSKYIYLDCQDDWKYREFNHDARKKYYKDFLLTHIPAEWIIEVQQDILNKLSKPIV